MPHVVALPLGRVCVKLMAVMVDMRDLVGSEYMLCIGDREMGLLMIAATALDDSTG